MALKIGQDGNANSYNEIKKSSRETASKQSLSEALSQARGKASNPFAGRNVIG
jgi:hypothetical protein